MICSQNHIPLKQWDWHWALGDLIVGSWVRFSLLSIAFSPERTTLSQAQTGHGATTHGIYTREGESHKTVRSNPPWAKCNQRLWCRLKVKTYVTRWQRLNHFLCVIIQTSIWPQNVRLHKVAVIIWGIGRGFNPAGRFLLFLCFAGVIQVCLTLNASQSSNKTSSGCSECFITKAKGGLEDSNYVTQESWS